MPTNIWVGITDPMMQLQKSQHRRLKRHPDVWRKEGTVFRSTVTQSPLEACSSVVLQTLHMQLTVHTLLQCIQCRDRRMQGKCLERDKHEALLAASCKTDRKRRWILNREVVYLLTKQSCKFSLYLEAMWVMNTGRRSTKVMITRTMEM